MHISKVFSSSKPLIFKNLTNDHANDFEIISVRKILSKKIRVRSE